MTTVDIIPLAIILGIIAISAGYLVFEFAKARKVQMEQFGR